MEESNDQIASYVSLYEQIIMACGNENVAIAILQEMRRDSRKNRAGEGK
jgi:hypothetical protein